MGFNGAAPMKARKPAQAAAELPAVLVLQWGRADEGAETTLPRFLRPREAAASMGPRR